MQGPQRAQIFRCSHRRAPMPTRVNSPYTRVSPQRHGVKWVFVPLIAFAFGPSVRWAANSFSGPRRAPSKRRDSHGSSRQRPS